MGGIEVDDGLRDGDEVDVMGRGREVGGTVVGDGDLAGRSRSIRRPAPGPVASSSQRTSA